MKRSWPIRYHLGALAALAALPFMGLVAFNLHQDFVERQRVSGERAQRLAVITAGQARRTLARARWLGERLVRRPELLVMDPSRCDPLFAQLRELLPEYANFLSIDLQGQPVCSGAVLAPPGPWSLDSRLYMEAATASGQFTVGRPMQGFVGRWVVMLAQPFRDASGSIAGLLALPLDLARFGAALAPADLPAGVALRIADSRGVIIADSSRSEEQVGQSMAGSALYAARAAANPPVASDDGVERIWGFSSVQGTDWQVYAGFPMEPIRAALRRSIAVNLSIALALLAVTSLLAFLLSRRISKPVEAVAKGARQVAQGHLQTRLHAAGPLEVANVAMQFNTMLDEIQAGESRLRNLFDQAADGIFVLSPEHRFLDVNPAGLALFGYTREELLQLHPGEVLAEHERSRLDPEVRSLMGGAPHLAEWTFRRKDGSAFVAEVSARADSPDQYLAIVRDLTPRHRHEQAQREAARRLQLAAKAGNVGLWDWDLESGAVFYSPEWKRQIGYEDHEIANQFAEWESRVHPDDLERCLAKVREYLERPYPGYQVEFRLRHRDGAYRWFLAHASLQLDESGKPVHMLGSHVDITERKAAEESLREHAGRLRDLYQRLMAVQETERRGLHRELHDRIGQDLAAAKLNVSLARSALPVAAAAGAATRLDEVQRLVQSAIDHSRDLMAELRPPGLDGSGLIYALELLVKAVPGRLGIQIALQRSGEFPRLAQEVEIAIYRIVQEALNNVAKHAGATRAVIRAEMQETRLLISVEDDGAGFDTDRLVPEGYGMDAMRERAEGVGAELRVQTRVGGGTRIIIALEGS